MGERLGHAWALLGWVDEHVDVWGVWSKIYDGYRTCLIGGVQETLKPPFFFSKIFVEIQMMHAEFPNTTWRIIPAFLSG